MMDLKQIYAYDDGCVGDFILPLFNQIRKIKKLKNNPLMTDHALQNDD